MTTAYFSKIEEKILSNLANAKHNLQIAVAWFTNHKLAASVEQLYKSGVKVEIILSDDIINFNNTKINFYQLIENGIQVRITRFPNLMHHKFCIIDHRILISGSYNWTLSAERNNFENIIISNDLNIVSLFTTEFSTLSKKSENLLSIQKLGLNSYMNDVEKSEEIKLITSSEINLNLFPEAKKKNSLSEVRKALFHKAELLYLRGKHQEAISICLDLLKLDNEFPEIYELISASKWRQGKFQEQVSFSQKAIEIDNLYYGAYNTLGIGYANLGNASKSIENYQICINAEPEQYIYYRNRALSYLQLEADSNIPKKLRDQFTNRANADFEKVIVLATKLENIDPHYRLYYSRAVAYLNLDKSIQAKYDFTKALELYKTTELSDQDSHELKEIRHCLRLIEKRI